MVGGVIEWTLLVLACVAGMFILQRLVARWVTDESKTDRVLKAGRPAQAVVLDTYDTGNRISAIYILTRLRLRVEPAEAEAAPQPFDVELTVPISPVKLAEFAPGRRIKVRVDPGTREVAVDQPRR
ncbi:MAG: hypothetical protein EOP81_11140 [Variovorax sp.]|nr:MAG: hypothetical protein EOP81_11140 [Variovorax sp.]